MELREEIQQMLMNSYERGKRDAFDCLRGAIVASQNETGKIMSGNDIVILLEKLAGEQHD